MPGQDPDEPVAYLTQEEHDNRDYQANWYGVVQNDMVYWEAGQTPSPPIPPPPPPVGPPPVPPVGDPPPVKKPKPAGP